MTYNVRNIIQEEIDKFRDEMRAYYVIGRLRLDRTAPTGNGDVQPSDREGDVVREYDSGGATYYEYTLVNEDGTLKWGRATLDTTF